MCMIFRGATFEILVQRTQSFGFVSFELGLADKEEAKPGGTGEVQRQDVTVSIMAGDQFSDNGDQSRNGLFFKIT